MGYDPIPTVGRLWTPRRLLLHCLLLAKSVG